MFNTSQIQIASGVIHVLAQEGAVFAITRGNISSDEACKEFRLSDAVYQSTIFKFHEESVCISIDIDNTDLAQNPAECIGRVMMLRRCLMNMEV